MGRLIHAFLLVFLFFGSLWGQPYRSNLGSSFTNWKIYWIIPDAEVTEEFSTAGDSVIAPHAYKIVNHWGSALGLYREDTLQGKAWFTVFGDPNGEQLIMDLGLQVGDTFWVNEWGVQTPAVVDSVFMVSGSKHVRTDFTLFPHSGADHLTFIEGIGPNAGVVFQSQSDGLVMLNTQYLLCAFKDQAQVYQNPLFPATCSIFSVGVEEMSVEATWQVYPNPVGACGALYLRGLPPGAMTATLTDVLGRSVRNMGSVHEGDALSCFGLPSGVYLLSLRQGSRFLGTKCIVVE